MSFLILDDQLSTLVGKTSNIGSIEGVKITSQAQVPENLDTLSYVSVTNQWVLSSVNTLGPTGPLGVVDILGGKDQTISFCDCDFTTTRSSDMVTVLKNSDITDNNLKITGKTTNFTNCKVNYSVGIDSNDSKWVSCGTSYTGYNSSLSYSIDGVNWYSIPNSTGILSKGNTVSWNGSIWTSGGVPGTKSINYSKDGIAWYSATGPTDIFNYEVRQIETDGNRFVAISSTGANNYISYSNDGIVWTPCSIDISFPGNTGIDPYGIGYNGCYWVVVGDTTTVDPDNSFMLVSNDGKNFHDNYNNFGSFSWTGTAPTKLSSVSWNGNIWVYGADDSVNKNCIWINGPGEYPIIQNTPVDTTYYLNYSTNYISDTPAYTGAYTVSTLLNKLDNNQPISPISLTSNFALPVGYVKNSVWTMNLYCSSDFPGVNVYYRLLQNNVILGTSSPLPVESGGCFNFVRIPISVPSLTISPGDTITVQFFANNTINDYRVVQIKFQGADLSTYSTLDFVRYTTPTTYLYPISNGLSNVRNIKWNGTQFLASGDKDTYQYLLSNDGLSWKGINTTTWDSIYNTTWDGRIWMGVGKLGSKISTGYSYDGILWTGVDSPSSALYNFGFGIEKNLEKRVKLAFPPNQILLLNNISGGWVGNGTLTGNPTSDKKTWKDFSSPIKINQAVWDGKKWIGVGVSGVASSKNGVDWQIVDTNVFDIQGNSVIYDGKKFIGVGQGKNSIAYSYDGFVWIPVDKSSQIISSGNKVFYDGKIYVAVGAGPVNSIAYSNDGISWIPVDNSSVNLLSEANSVYSNGAIWIAVGKGTKNTIIYSNDGILWKGNGKNIFVNSGNGIGWNGQLWIAIGQGINSLAYSNDGVGWYGLGKSIFNNFGNDVIWVGNRWLAVGNDCSYSLGYSYNGKDWFSEENLNSNSVQAISWNNPDIGYPIMYQQTLCLGNSVNGNTIYTSDNGIFWKAVGSNIFTTGNNAFWNGVMWVAVGTGSNTLAYSSDGVEWTGLGNSIFSEGKCVSWNGNVWVAGGVGTNTIAYSYDGINWTGIGDTVMTTSGNGVMWTGKAWVMVGEGAYKIVKSVDGINWTGVSESIFTNKLLGICISSSKLIAVGEGLTQDEIGYSLDGGDTWISSATGVFGTVCNSVFWNSEKYVAVGGTTHSIAYSSDGINWTVSSDAFAGGECNSVSWNGERWNSVGSNIILYSYDGISWYNSDMNVNTMTNGYGIVSNPKIGAVYIPNRLNIKTGQQLKYVAPRFYDKGINEPTDISIILQT
jgi:hypothetical protein